MRALATIGGSATNQSSAFYDPVLRVVYTRELSTPTWAVANQDSPAKLPVVIGEFLLASHYCTASVVAAFMSRVMA